MAWPTPQVRALKGVSRNDTKEPIATAYIPPQVNRFAADCRNTTGYDFQIEQISDPNGGPVHQAAVG